MSDERFRSLSREERLELCREVMERLSDLVEGEAPPDFCERVDEVLGDCQPFQTYRDTLAATIRLAQECGGLEPAAGPLDEDAFRRCVENARRRLARGE